jgi:hypothetical protein
MERRGVSIGTDMNEEEMRREEEENKREEEA